MSLSIFENDLYSFHQYVCGIFRDHNKKEPHYYFPEILYRCIENGYFSERKIEEKMLSIYDENFSLFRHHLSIPICKSKWQINYFTYSPELAEEIITTCISGLNNTGYFKAIEDDYPWLEEDNVLHISLSFSSEAADLESDEIGFSGLLHEFDHNAFNSLCTPPNDAHVEVHIEFESWNCILLNTENNNVSYLHTLEIQKLIKGYEIQNVIDTVKSYFPSHFINEQVLMPRGF